ncbi:MAG: hypothetical protein GYB67_12365, partial [Chloroflexi bacterium]|nr:hypothetical protein [Chloroflexota bacterium]
KRKEEEFKLFKELYNNGWEQNWGFVPMTPHELDGMVEALGTFFDPELAFFAYVGDQPAGFVLAVPNFNEVLARVYPRPEVPQIVTLLQALYYWKIRPVITMARLPLMGVIPEFRGKGVDAVLYLEILHAITGRYAYNDSGWILEDNMSTIGIADKAGLTRYKTHRFYEKGLADG